MYSSRKIPDPFQKKIEKTVFPPVLPSCAIEAKEKSLKKTCGISPLAVLLLMDIFRKGWLKTGSVQENCPIK